jgi:hypothetical protein
METVQCQAKTPVLALQPCYSWFELPYYWAGLKAYDLVAVGNNLAGSSYLSAAESMRRFPTLAARRADGASLKGTVRRRLHFSCVFVLLFRISKSAVHNVVATSHAALLVQRLWPRCASENYVVTPVIVKLHATLYCHVATDLTDGHLSTNVHPATQLQYCADRVL